jgi:hypothetical protein
MPVTKVFGCASYGALRYPDDGRVELTAVGVLPCANYFAQLEMRPESASPPAWNLVFYLQEICLTALKPFELKVLMEGGNSSEILVYDATFQNQGPIRVPISDPYVPFASDTKKKAAPPELFSVYAKLPPPNVKLKGPYGCIVVPEGSILPAIYYQAYGPSPKSACDKFLLETCIEYNSSDHSDDKPVKGPEVPWPKFKRV